MILFFLQKNNFGKRKTARKRAVSRIQGSRNQKNQDSKTQGSQREKPRHRAIALMGIRHIEGAEPEPAVVEAEDRGAPELATRARRELVACTVGV